MISMNDYKKQTTVDMVSYPTFRIYKRFLITSAMVIGVVLIAVFGIKGTMDEIGITDTSIGEAENRLAVVIQKDTTLSSLDQSLLTVQKQKLDLAIPPNINLPLILSALLLLSEESEVELGEFSISSNSQAVSIVTIENADSLPSFQFKVEINGPLDNLKNFISNLGTILPVMQTDAIEFDNSKSKATISFHFQPDSIVKNVPVDAPLPVFTSVHQNAINEVFSMREAPLGSQISTPSSTTADRDNPFQ